MTAPGSTTHYLSATLEAGHGITLSDESLVMKNIGIWWLSSRFMKNIVARLGSKNHIVSRC